MAKIACKQKREGGSRVKLGTKTYHFQPDAHGRHVADVHDEDHAQTLLAIAEGFELVAEESDEAGSDLLGSAPTTGRRKKAASTAADGQQDEQP